VTLDVRVRAIALGVYLALCGVALFGQEHKVTLNGTLFEANHECHFILDPEGESESVELVATSGVFLCDYLRGTKRVVITISPQP